MRARPTPSALISNPWALRALPHPKHFDSLLAPLGSPRWFSVPQLPVRLLLVQAAVKPGRLEAGVQALWAELRGIGLGRFEASELAAAAQALKASPSASAD